jgi:hypothetical protein
MTDHETWTPSSCPRCAGHRLRVTRVWCADCGLELAADDLGPACACASGAEKPQREKPQREKPQHDEDAAGEGSPAASGSARDQILARVAAGELPPALAADLLARLDEAD